MIYYLSKILKLGQPGELYVFSNAFLTVKVPEK